MKCARCSAEIPRQSQFCLRCGTPIQGTASTNPAPLTMPPSAAFAAPRPNTRPFLIAIALLALLVIGLGAMVVRGQLAQKAGQNTPGELVQAPGANSPGSLVQAPGDANPNNMVQAPGDTTPNNMVQAPSDMPNATDVTNYLQFLKQIEASRKKLEKDQASALNAVAATLPAEQIKQFMGYENGGTGTGGDETSAKARIQVIEKTATDFNNQWEQLSKAFSQRTPPDSCADLRNKYYDFLGRFQGEMSQITNLFVKAFNTTDPTEMQNVLRQAYSMQGMSSDVDVAIKKADDALADVCNKFKLKKDFDISEAASGSGGLGGLLH